MSCSHRNIEPEFVDQTLGVYCPDCGLAQVCWQDEHVSEYLWNLACVNDKIGGAKPCEQNRKDVCFLCSEPCEI